MSGDVLIISYAYVCIAKTALACPFYTLYNSYDYVVPKPLFTEIEKKKYFSIYTRSDLNKIREENRSLQKFFFANNSVMA